MADGARGAPAPAAPASHARGVSGFSLIELLAALAILMIIVGILGMVFSESDRAWNLGTGRVVNNTEGRAMLNMIAHDLQYAVADRVLSMRLRREPDITARPYGLECSDIAFVSLQHDSSESPRTAREITYYVIRSTRPDATGQPYNRYQLIRNAVGDAISDPASASKHSYHDSLWYDRARVGTLSRSVLSENIAGFRVYPDGSNIVNDLIITNNMPFFVDVYLELLNERDALRAAQMARDFNNDQDSRVIGFVEKNARRYTTRVYFHNRSGYEQR